MADRRCHLCGIGVRNGEAEPLDCCGLETIMCRDYDACLARMVEEGN